LEAHVGKTIILDCVCEAEPEPDIDWLFNGKIVRDQGRFRYMFERGNVIGLEIKEITPDDEGEYECMAFNDSGEISCKCTLTVTDPTKKEETSFAKPGEKNKGDKRKKSGKKKTRGNKKKMGNKIPIDRDGIKCENPEKYYEFNDDEIGRGRFSVVKVCTKKADGSKYAAKIIKFDSESLKFAIREYDMMTGGRLNHFGLAQLHEAYVVRKYLILIMELVEGNTLLDQISHRHTLTEDDVSQVVRQILEILVHMADGNIAHLDLRPTNIRVQGKDVKIVDYNSCRSVFNRKEEVADVIGDSEFCAPEMLSFNSVVPETDMWAVGVITYVLLSGISPFFHKDAAEDQQEDQIIDSITNVKWEFDKSAFETISSDAKEFIMKCLVKSPKSRLNARDALKEDFFKMEKAEQRKNSKITAMEMMQKTDKRLFEKEEEEYIEASLVFRTFEEEEYESPESSEEEEN